ncbi:MAG: hypothetical protein KDC48_21730 [Planctomycetes bacterium]|nr:hypothetical protein [Planctomycetota bacterium]
MPKLSSGRHVAIAPFALVDLFRYAEHEEFYRRVLLFRLRLRKPADLLRSVPVARFDETAGEPPNAPAYRTGFNVADVLDGKAGWTEQEVDEFRHWLDTDPRLPGELQAAFDEINDVIRDSPFWMEDARRMDAEDLGEDPDTWLRDEPPQ